MRNGLLLAAALAAALFAGCATAESRQAEKVSGDRPMIVARAGDFFMAVNSGNFAAVKALILPSQAGKTNVAEFVARTMRHPNGSYDAVVFSPNRLLLAPSKVGDGYVTAATLTIRIKETGLTQPQIVTLYWKSSGATWYIDPMPGVAKR